MRIRIRLRLFLFKALNDFVELDFGLVVSTHSRDGLEFGSIKQKQRDVF